MTDSLSNLLRLPVTLRSLLLGLTVALFVAGQAFDGSLQGASKMGALFSGGVAFVAIIAGVLLRVKEPSKEAQSEAAH